ncbi:MAG TPA: hypothetical protein VFX96_06790, partial [Pyrinomonadaceae bacterium]|nr:hypothetical protein [Pyrinomonadaceae bacterium]
RFYDPGTSYVEQGMLRWQEEGQDALVTDPKQPTFVRTPFSPAEKSKESRRAKLTLDADGTLAGEVTIEYTGHRAADMKEIYDDKSPAEREEMVKAQVKSRLGADVEGVEVENVTDPVKPFVQRFKVRVPGYAQRTGKRLFLQPNFFEKGTSPLFPTSERRHHIYFNYPWAEDDVVEITLPEGYAPDNPQAPATFNAGSVSTYQPKLSITKDGRTIVYRRSFQFSGNLIPATSYGQLKTYFDEVHKQDGHTLSLKQATTTDTSASKPPSN